jgi:hypothetical protein
MQNVKATGKGKKKPVSARLSVIFARQSPTAIIFRRGPSKWVQLIKWNTDTDEFVPGQWFHGKIYDRRSDLSPDGTLLIYFAQKITGRTLADAEYTYAWTAISKPPFLTALALWPKGDCWHGGGSFLNNQAVLLNHAKNVSEPHPEHKPTGLKVRLREKVTGEDDPIYSERLDRDGWKQKQEWLVRYEGRRGFVTSQPEVRQKDAPSDAVSIEMVRSINDLDYSEEFTVMEGGARATPIVGASWVDWDHRGRLIVAKDGKISVATVSSDGRLVEQELEDFNLSKPNPVKSPEWATRW